MALTGSLPILLLYLLMLSYGVAGLKSAVAVLCTTIVLAAPFPGQRPAYWSRAGYTFFIICRLSSSRDMSKPETLA